MSGSSAWRWLTSNLSRQSSASSFFRPTVQEDPLHLKGSNTEDGSGGRNFAFRESLMVQAAQILPCYQKCKPADCNPPGSSVHGILQARILEWACHCPLQGIFPTQGLNLGLLYWQVDSSPSKPPGKPEKVRYTVGRGGLPAPSS